MKRLVGVGFGLCLTIVCGGAHAQPVDDPLLGIDLGMDRSELAALVASAGAVLDCRDPSTIARPKAGLPQYCTADLPIESQQKHNRLEALLAPSPESVLRVVAVVIEGPSGDAAAARDRLVQRWGEPTIRRSSAGARESAHWRLGARVLVLSQVSRGGEAFSIEYSQSSWARQTARSVGMAMALP